MINTASCVFEGPISVVISNVHDPVLFLADEDAIDSLLSILWKQFRVKDLGRPKRLLRLYVIWNDNSSASLSQKQPINKLLEDTFLVQWKPLGSLVNENTMCDEAESKLLEIKEHIMYLSNIESLVYTAPKTRPGLSVVTNRPSSYMHESMLFNIVAAKRALHYLGETRGWWIALNQGCDEQLPEFADTNWGEFFEKYRKYCSVALVKYRSAVMPAAQNLTKVVSFQPSWGWVCPLSEAVRKVVWLRKVVNKLVVRQIMPRILQASVGCNGSENAAQLGTSISADS